MGEHNGRSPNYFLRSKQNLPTLSEYINVPDAIYKCHFNNTKAFPEGTACKTCFKREITGILLLVTLLFLLLGVVSITETSCQTVDSGQVEDTRWSEESSDVVKVNVFLLIVE